jgi:hypothetical protein
MRMLIVFLFVAGCTNSKPHIKCTDSAQCSLPGRPGVCIDSACAVADSSCASGYRYDTAAGASGECVALAVEVPDLTVPPAVDMATADMTEPEPPADMAQSTADLAPASPCAGMPEGAQCATFVCDDATVSTTTGDLTIVGHCQAGACMANGIAAVDPKCSPYKCYRSLMQNKYVCSSHCECESIGHPCAPGHTCMNCPPGNSSGGMCI